MRRRLSIIKGVVLSSAILLLVMVPGGAAFAETAEACTPPSPTQSGVRWPTGSDAGTFTYQCEGPYAGKWTNSYYVYDPATNLRNALYDPNYNFDCTAKQWYMTRWDYSAAKGTYFENSVAVDDPGGIATNCPLPTPTTTSPESNDPTGSSTTDSSTNSSSLAAKSASPNSGQDVNGTASNDAGINNTSGTTMNNGIISFANSGNAAIADNTNAGSATSGDAQVIANVINMLQSSSNILDIPNLITFTANINGDVNGDLLLDPTKLSAIQPANTSAALTNNLTVNNTSDTALNNDINLGAGTGDATVSSNTNAGDATTGTANAVANIVNVLNSAITAGQSFLGVININGNLNGDILLPPNFVDTLLASNVPRYSINTANIDTTLAVNNTSNQAITNAIQADAASGNASVRDNTSAGSATSGTAGTNLTIFNLTGSNVVASNDLLVFVNVLGTWYGLIMNAPAGTTAASLGGGVDSASLASNTVLNNTSNQTINNKIKVAAASGDATVAENTKAGNATSGNASASVNLMNMINNNFSLSGWFGLLFINVFGTWNGSFGINTSAGDPTPFAEFAPTSASNATSTNNVAAQLRVFHFVPKQDQAVTNTTNETTPSEPAGVVLASQNLHKPAANTVTLPGPDAIRPNMAIFMVGTSFALLILAIGERQRIFRFFHLEQ